MPMLYRSPRRFVTRASRSPRAAALAATLAAGKAAPADES